MFRQQISNLSRFTSSTLKYAASSTTSFFVPSSWSLQDPGVPSQQLIEFWIADTQRGLDALLNDQFDLAHDIFAQHCSVSPFHAIGYALMTYVEAMLAFDVQKIQEATHRIAAAENVARQLGKRVRGSSNNNTVVAGWRSSNKEKQAPGPIHHTSNFDPNQSISISFSSATTEEQVEDDDSSTQKSSSSGSSTGTVMTAPEEPTEEEQHHSMADQPLSQTNNGCSKEYRRSVDLLCELIEVNCMLMSATVQFLGSSWIEYMKATYRLRKSYKMYEHLFEELVGQKTSDYANMLRKQRRSSSSTTCHQFKRENAHVNKRFSFFGLPTRKPSMDHLRHSTFRRRSLSSSPLDENTDTTSRNDRSSALESGVFFGIGLFSLIFSLLPPRVNRILNTLGFHSSRPFALHVLQRSYESRGLYSSLSALTLLIYYTNLTLFIHPRLFPSSISPETARSMLNDMKTRYPNNKIWELLEGKLCKMEGMPRRGVEILRDSRRRRMDGSGKPVRSEECFAISDLAQLQALAVYEMGWGQIFLGDYFQASETFFRLESINNWSRAFYHYIATCCMFANEQYDKAGMEFHQIPGILERKRQLGGRLLPNEAFAERKIRRWKEKAQKVAAETLQHPWMTQQQVKERYSLLDGDILKQVVVVNPLWELIYLWNGVPQLTKEMQCNMKERLERCIEQQPSISDIAILHLLLGVVCKELDEHQKAEECFKLVIGLDTQVQEDRWAVPYAMYELAALGCFQLQYQHNHNIKLNELRSLVNNAEQYFSQQRRSTSASPADSAASLEETYVTEDTHDWDSRLHVRCQLLLEKLDECRCSSV
ncbi:hypothetical protein K492DRAFT_173356 [Lichtheimia hyalospora FSU 10163]|nr:hypothetical protein K492DRAFT_173356 [Lichtheimia hyalospora FSU 10163]